MALSRRPYLIQRLRKPFKGEGKWAALSEGFAFGGGLRNGGLTKEAMDLLRDIWSFDYMGSAEFEFGAVPKALQKIAKAEDLTAFQITVTTKEKKSASIHVICREADKADVTAWILAKGKNEWGGNDLRTKEAVGLQGAVNREEYKKDLGGWLELDTGFLFFIDPEMFDKAAQLFEVARAARSAPAESSERGTP